MSSLMLNFRVKEEFAHALDQAARRVNMTRSDFIRSALEKVVEGGSLIATPKRPSAPKRPVAPRARRECLHPKDSLVPTPTGIKICNACGARIS